jgi:tetratricopeptide (TPR) repeat protein
MDRRKRQSRSRPERRDRGQHAFGIADKLRSGSKDRGMARRWLFGVAVGGVLLLAGIWVQSFLFAGRASLEALPDPNLTGVETQVAARIRELQQDVEKHPESATAWGKLAMNLDVHDFKGESIPCYKQAAALDPAESRWPYYCALVLRDMGSPEALQWFERSRNLQPDNAASHIQYAQALSNFGRTEEAARAFNRAIALDPRSSHAYLGLAQIALSQSNVHAGYRHLMRAVDINPRHGEAHGLLAEVYRRLNEPENAERELHLAQLLPKTTPLNDPMYAELAAEGISAFWYRKRAQAYMERGHHQMAVAEFRRALQVKPDAQAHDDLGVALQALGKFDEAAEHHRAALALNPKFVEALNNLATALFETGRIEEAIAYVKEVQKLHPAFPEAYLNLGTFYMRAGREAEAIEAFRQGLARTPDHLRLAMRLAWLLATSSPATLRNGSEAVRLAKTVCEKTDYLIPETLDVLAAAYAEVGQFDQAIELARRAHQLLSSAQRTKLAGQIQARLKYYEARQPYREKGP